ncbi:MAG: hypothetical protein BM555_02840 [Crocinitomix sp. MedPE-SWsnd]|nr:MAG: hypothetical protein BM555_02840 [Crocinitomix sp. MedPE-SWsnd]
MKNIAFLLPLSILFIQCSGEEQTETSHEEISTDTIVTDTIAEEVIEAEAERVEIDIDALFAKADTTLKIPFVVDSAFIDSIMYLEGELDEKALSNVEVQHLGFKMVESGPTMMASYCINSFIKIDSLKLKGEYEDYLEQLDIGQTKRAGAAVIGKITELGSTQFLIWMTDYSTLEACPYGSGTYIWATIFEDEKPTNTILLGESSGGADAPYWGDTFTTSVLEIGKVTTKTIEESGGDEDPETGEEIVDHSENEFITWITLGWFEAEEGGE